jgi:hypothetical protein
LNMKAEVSDETSVTYITKAEGPQSVITNESRRTESRRCNLWLAWTACTNTCCFKSKHGPLSCLN